MGVELRKEYGRKLEEANKDHFMRERVGQWLIDQAERTAKEVREANQQLVENALRNKAVSNKINTFK